MAEFLLPPHNTIISQLALVEVESLMEGGTIHLCPAMIKLMLRELCVASCFFVIHVDKETFVRTNNNTSASSSSGSLDEPQTLLICHGLVEMRTSQRTENNNSTNICNEPFVLQVRNSNNDIVPCQIRGFLIAGPDTATTTTTTRPCIITDGTFVRIVATHTHNVDVLLSSSDNLFVVDNNLSPSESTSWHSLVLSCHDKAVVDSLALQMSIRLQKHCTIGTTSDAIHIRNYNKRRVERCKSFTNTFFVKGAKTKNIVATMNEDDDDGTAASSSSLLDEGILCVFDEVNGSGKTELVKVVACSKLKCHQVHVITAGMLFAKYGVLRADCGLRSLLHSIIASAAIRGEKVCIILDHLDDFLPSRNNSNPSSPCLHAIAAYISFLSQVLMSGGIIPFPKDSLLNLATDGICLSVQVCVIGVLTLFSPARPLELRRRGANHTTTNNKHHSTTLISDSLVGSGRFYLHPPSASTRLGAFVKAFHVMGLDLDKPSQSQLPKLACSALAARGPAFLQTARRIRIRLRQNAQQQVTLSDLRSAFVPLLEEKKQGQVLFSVAINNNTRSSQQHTSTIATALLCFENVGGNKLAKLALEDALAFNEVVKMRLTKFGQSAPSGVLFYGPPGTGKTLLARAAAEYLFPGNEGIIGGAFLSLKASEVVRGEIGTSEHILVNAFETARSNSPSVVFIDEFEALFSDRASRSSGSRLESTMLQCMDDVTKWRKADDAAAAKSSDVCGATVEYKIARVIVLGATNMPWMIDNAFLRPGRFDRVIHVGLPTLEERKSIFQVHLRKMKLQQHDCIDDNIESMSGFLAARCDSFSGADIEALCRAAAVRCLRSGSKAVSFDDFLAARDNDVTTPSCNSAMVARLLQWKP